MRIGSRSKKNHGQPRITFPKRGEVYLVNFDPTIGSEIKKTRPALILQNDIANRYSPITIVRAVWRRAAAKRLTASSMKRLRPPFFASRSMRCTVSSGSMIFNESRAHYGS